MLDLLIGHLNIITVFPTSGMDKNLLVVRFLKVVLEPHDGVDLLLRGHVWILRESETHGLHELADGSRPRTPGLKMMLEEDVIIEWVITVVKTWGNETFSVSHRVTKSARLCKQ